MVTGDVQRHADAVYAYATLLHDQYLANPPNYIFSYSNVGYGLLGHAIQQVSGTEFSAGMDATLLRPLGMEHASFNLRADVTARLAKGYERGTEKREPPLGNVPAGNLHASVRDLSRFISMVLANGTAGNRQIMRPETLAEMTRAQHAGNAVDMGMRMGLGWFLDYNAADIPGYHGPRYGHGGATYYYHSKLLVFPREKLGVVVLSNSAEGAHCVGDLAMLVAKAAIEAKSGKKIVPPKPEPMPPIVTATRDELQAVAGSYAVQYGNVGILRLYLKGNRLYARAGGYTLEMLPRKGGTFSLKAPKILGLFPLPLGELGKVRFGFPILNNRRMLVVYRGIGQMLAGTQVEPVAIPAAWRNRLGSYSVINSDDRFLTGFALTEIAGFLAVRVTLDGKTKVTVALAPQNDAEAVILGIGRAVGDTVRIIQRDGEDQLYYSGYYLRREGK